MQEFTSPPTYRPVVLRRPNAPLWRGPPGGGEKTAISAIAMQGQRRIPTSTTAFDQPSPCVFLGLFLLWQGIHDRGSRSGVCVNFKVKLTNQPTSAHVCVCIQRRQAISRVIMSGWSCRSWFSAGSVDACAGLCELICVHRAIRRDHVIAHELGGVPHITEHAAIVR